MSESKKYFSLWILLVCILVFIFQQIIPGFTETFLLTSDAITKPWQFLTSIFLHGSLAHLAYNMFALVFFGLILESMIGSKKFLLLFILSGILANIVSFPFYESSLGASGAIMGVLACVAVLRPMMTVWAFGMIMPMFILAIIWAAGSFLGIFGFGDQGTGYIAHLGGLVIGTLYGFYLRFFRIKRENQEQKGIRVYNFSNKIQIPEEDMRKWEDRFMK